MYWFKKSQAKQYESKNKLLEWMEHYMFAAPLVTVGALLSSFGEIQFLFYGLGFAFLWGEFSQHNKFAYESYHFKQSTILAGIITIVCAIIIYLH